MKILPMMILSLLALSTACSHDRSGTDAGAGYSHSMPGTAGEGEMAEEMSAGDPQTKPADEE